MGAAEIAEPAIVLTHFDSHINICKAAGVHIYSDAGDVVYANRNFLCVYTPAGGHRVLHLPAVARVVDVMEDRLVSANASEFAIDTVDNETRIYHLQRER